MNRLTASVSLDLDNMWSYQKTHGDAGWQSFPSYLDVVVPHLLDLFAGLELTATVFVVGQDAALERNREALGLLAAAGHEVGNHSFSHEPWLHLYTPSQLDDELARTEDAIQEVTGQRPTGFRGPGYSLSRPLLCTLVRRGYAYDASTLPTWVGPLARAYYFRSAGLTTEQRRQRQALFGSAREGLRPLAPYRFTTPEGPLVELPVTTMPLLRLPVHLSYVLYLHAVSPALARRWFGAAMRLCRAAGVGPSVLLHPLDLLGPDDAPGLAFFPGMGLPGDAKREVVRAALVRLNADFDLVGTGEHARRLVAGGRLRDRLPTRVAAGTLEPVLVGS